MLDGSTGQSPCMKSEPAVMPVPFKRFGPFDSQTVFGLSAGHNMALVRVGERSGAWLDHVGNSLCTLLIGECRRVRKEWRELCREEGAEARCFRKNL